LILLPELSFTGYNFSDPGHIAGFLETRERSPSREWARGVARENACYVVVGRPVRNEAGGTWNGVVVVDGRGEVVHEYAKHHMFGTDWRWGCSPGPGFSSLSLQIGSSQRDSTSMDKAIATAKDTESTDTESNNTSHVNGNNVAGNIDITLPEDNHPPSPARTINTSVGICMDLNPQDYKSPQAYEYPTYLLSRPSHIIPLILLPMAWLRHSDPLDSTHDGPGEMTLNYWIQRLDPLVWDARRRWVVICNRTGEEDGAEYAGTSCVLGVGRGEVCVRGLLGREEGFIDVEIEI